MSDSGARLLSVNLAVVRQNPFKGAERTGIDKRPVDVAVEVRSPGSRAHGQGSGLVGDYIGDRRSHGGDDQSVYAYAVEDLQWWADELGTTLKAGQFGENITTEGVDVNGARIGERWRVGDDVELQVTDPRIPCATFRGWMNRSCRRPHRHLPPPRPRRHRDDGVLCPDHRAGTAAAAAGVQ